MTYKLGSLFDGSGGFPLAGSLCGITPTWASEVEPYPVAVTRSRFPSMKHLGDISKVNGAEIEPVDIITFGSPCQDLSVAGKRAGLKHEANGDEETTRSGLFMEAVRIIKEMREATNGRYPTFALWENVPGAFSSNKGEDFRIVCEELIKIVEPSAVMPAVPKNGWPYADSYVGDGWSLAYRVFDAQYWGVPQRRRRIHLVVDFRGKRAREVLFEREGVRGYFAQGRTPWQATASYAEGSSGADDREGVGLDIYNLAVTNNIACSLTTATGQGASNTGPSVMQPIVDSHILDDQGGSQLNVRTDGKCPTLRAEMHGNIPAVMEPVTLEPGIAAREGGHIYEGVSGTLRAEAGDNRMAVAYSIENHPADSRVSIDNSGKVQTLTSRMGTGGGNVPMVMEAFGFDRYNQCATGEVCETLRTPGGGDNYPTVCYCLQGNGIDRADTAGCNGKGWNDETCYTLNTIDRPAVAYSIGNGQLNQISMSPVCNTLDCMHDKQAMLMGTFQPIHDEVHEFISDNNADAPHQQDLLQTPEDVARTIACGTHAAGSHLTKTVINLGGRYIVRRLTPTECARLQGFPDKWGHPEQKEAFSEEEYRFWLAVRNTHAAINGKKEQAYTETQMLTWYNKLHTDSSEYKMWGNGIALPPALYCLQGIRAALDEGRFDEATAPQADVREEEVCEVEEAEPVSEEIQAVTEKTHSCTNSDLISAYAKVYRHRKRLTRQQMRTLKGQIQSGDVDGAMRGLEKLLKREGL